MSEQATVELPLVDVPPGRRRDRKRVSLERTRQAWAKRVLGWTMERIAEHLGVSRMAVSKMLRRADKIALAQLVEDIRRVKALQHERLDHVYCEAMQAWERSKLPKKAGTKRTTYLPPDGHAEPVKAGESVTQSVEEQAGDVRYLQEARAALADQRKLWGLDATIQANAPGEANVLVINTIEAQAPSRPGPDGFIEVEARTRGDGPTAPPAGTPGSARDDPAWGEGALFGGG